MKDFESFEELREHWKAAENAAAEVDKYYEAERYYQRVYALDAAMKINNKPSNTQMQTDELMSCPNCKIDRVEGFNFCYKCGRNYAHR